MTQPSEKPRLRAVPRPPESNRPPAPPKQDDRGLPRIRLGLDLHRVVDETQGALSHDAFAYQRPHELVVVARTAGYAKGCPLEPGSPLIVPLNVHSLATRLSTVCRYEKVEPVDPRELKRAHEHGFPPPQPDVKLVQAPDKVLQATLHATNWLAMRPLVGIRETPFLRPDGTVWQTPGYDAMSGYLYHAAHDYPLVDEHPTEADAHASLLELESVFDDFPHVDRAARMVPLAALLTLMARPAIHGAIPGFAFDATTRSSGKTMQADVVSMIALGREASRTVFPSDGRKVAEEELSKTLLSYALAGASVVLFDNIDVPIHGASLEACLTARKNVDLRVLGKSEIRSLPWTAVLLLSGNNLTFGQDTASRVLRSRLESQLERPEERTDFKIKGELVEHVARERPRFVRAALTILRAYYAAGCPKMDVRPWRYTAWSQVVAQALVFAGGVDVTLARPGDQEIVMGDLDSLDVILEHWPRLERELGMAVTCKRLLDRVYPAPKSDEEPDGWDELREAIETACPTRPGATPAARSLGERFRGWHGRVRGARKLVRCATKTTGSTTQWKVVQVVAASS